ncbi:MAG: TonB-dependent receptor [Pseudomonadota bacterium]
MVVTDVGVTPDPPPSLAEIDRDTLDQLIPIHPSELRLGAPGLWVSRGSGQEHLMAIRSPVLTGAGACGAFGYLEHGVPVRPVGLCNVNQLFEINLEQADRIRIQRGPAPLNPAAGGLHGSLDVQSDLASAHTASLLHGPDDFTRASVDVGQGQSNGFLWRARALATHAGGFRRDSGYDHGKFNLDLARPGTKGEWRVHISGASLQQETAGFIRGFEAFADPDIAFSNPNPEAFRDAWALRAVGAYERDRWTLTPFFRRSRMVFLQHFLPGQPLEINAQTSAGLALAHRIDGETWSWQSRALIEASDMQLFEDQAQPITTGSAFLQATRPAGRHYDFDVGGRAVTATGQLSWRVGERHRVGVGVRVDGVRYAYQTRLADGNLDADGNACGFGGCLFTRPADRNDRFTSLSPSLTWQWAPTDATSWTVTAARGVRMPQITELYRLQSGQAVADLDPESLDSLELGVDHRTSSLQARAVAFAGIKRDGIFRDSDGFNVNRARTLHAGFEFAGQLKLHPRATLSASFTLAAHRYRFLRLTPGAEPIQRNNDVDTAPRTLGQLALTLFPLPDTTAHVEWEHMGGYWLDAANAHRYGGHDLIHATVTRQFGPWSVGIKLRNVMDRAYAERGDFAFGQYRYFPGQPRSLFFSAQRRFKALRQAAPSRYQGATKASTQT